MSSLRRREAIYLIFALGIWSSILLNEMDQYTGDNNLQQGDSVIGLYNR